MQSGQTDITSTDELLPKLNVSELEEILRSPDLIDSLAVSQSGELDPTALEEITSLVKQIQSAMRSLKSQRQRLVEEKELLALQKKDWHEAEVEMHRALRPHTVTGIIEQLRQQLAEQESLGKALLMSFNEQSESASNSEVLDFLKEYKKLQEKTWTQRLKLDGISQHK